MNMPLKSKLLAIIIFMIIFLLLPRAFTKTSEIKSMVIVTALGIDCIEDDIEVSAQIIIPKAQAGTTRSIMSISSRDKNLSNGLENISTYIGKNVGIEHCDAIILGKSISEKGVCDVLDYFFRGNKIEHNTLLIYFDGSAKELIDSTSNIDNNFSLTIDEITKFSGEYFYTLETTLEEFYSQHYSDNKVSLLGGLKIDNSEYGLKLSSQSNENKGENQGENKSGEGKTEDKYLINNGEIAIFKDWKLVKIMDIEQTIAMNWFIHEAKKSSLIVENVNDNLYDGASVILTITNKTNNFNTKFVGEIPVLTLNINISAKIENILGGDKEKLKDINENMFTTMLKSKIKSEIIRQAESTIKFIKNEKIDTVRIYDEFEKYHYNKLKDVIKNYGYDYFYNNLQVEINVNIIEKI